MRLRLSALLLLMVLSGCDKGGRPSIFALCSESDGWDRATIKFSADGLWQNYDFGGSVAPCPGSTRPCMAEPLALAVPPVDYRRGRHDLAWRDGGIDFFISTFDFPDRQVVSIRAETKDEIHTYDYDVEKGITRVIVTPKDKSRFASAWRRCDGRLRFEDLAGLLKRRPSQPAEDGKLEPVPWID